ncbi:alpha/beta hydrolase [Pseudomonas fluorescens]|uniref:Alpha/beta hydrolase n=1 Tax=Pseudomonas fluorescens TaxID=294 RepID=A0A1B3CWR0_PSEFL|nr:MULTISPECIES: alpha/beta family hydrolase [Pseudomonas]AOE69486.1 alpha/beta hydrolase [Pseudomonas fluorescens]AOE75197.1 alpha/beta hydrolase [Pseudomonas fluorescens]PMX29105.1 alpha/beta hydrolase [Pseudomonas sp. GW460-12]PMX35923.1 alpha/beta hydrolase [Pseudomonas sp. MPR-R2A4]PMX42127.1 alpha/beta hydrolase [Pseudomonas sp. MPR-R2A7]
MSKEHKASIDGDQWAQCVREHGWLWDAAAEGDRREPVTLILAHGAGAPMDSTFMTDMAARLALHGVNVLRFEFPYMAQRRVEGGKRPPNPAAKLLQAWREVHAEVRRHVAGTLAIGGKSMGGRMASLVADELGVDGLVCLGYPFYAVGKPEKPRVEHLAGLQTPTLIVQGERDALGNRVAVEGYDLSPSIEVMWLVAGDHDLKPLKASGFSHEQHLEAAAVQVARFLGAL